MTTFTTNFGWPKPGGTDAPDGPTQIGALADAEDATVFGISAQLPYRARQILGGSVSPVTFSGIPSTLRRLTVRWTARSDAAVNLQGILIRINTDAGNNYTYSAIVNTNATVTGVTSASTNLPSVGDVTGASAPAGAFASGTIEIVGWDSPHSTFLGYTFVNQALATGVANCVAIAGGGVYLSAGPYTSVQLLVGSGNFVAGSDFQIEGAVT